MNGLLREAYFDKTIGTYKNEDSWSSSYYDSDPVIKQLYHCDSKFIKLKCPQSKGVVERIENKFLWGCYALKYEEKCAMYGRENVEEEIMFHVTSISNAMSIARTNFDWRLKNRSRFGQGVCFATSQTYGYKYATVRGATLVCGVLRVTGKSHHGGYTTTIPKQNYDETVDERGKVVVKYSDHEFYPYYIVM